MKIILTDKEAHLIATKTQFCTKMKKFISGLKEKVDGGTSQPKGSTGSTPPHPAARGVQAQKPIQNGKGPALYPAEVLRVERLGFLDDSKV